MCVFYFIFEEDFELCVRIWVVKLLIVLTFKGDELSVKHGKQLGINLNEEFVEQHQQIAFDFLNVSFY